MTPYQIATLNLAAYEAQWQAAGIHPPDIANQIILTRYETEHDLRTLRPEDGPDASLDTHNAILDAFASLLQEKYNITPRTITLDAASYLRWLASENLTNTAQNRAAFNALQQLILHPMKTTFKISEDIEVSLEPDGAGYTGNMVMRSESLDDYDIYRLDENGEWDLVFDSLSGRADELEGELPDAAISSPDGIAGWLWDDWERSGELRAWAAAMKDELNATTA